MKWGKQVAIVVPLLGVVWVNPLADVGRSTTPAPADVVVEIKANPNLRLPLNPLPAHPSSPASQPPPTFNSQQLDRQLGRYIAYLEKFGAPDILIVGSSRALQGVDPIALQQGLAQQGYPDLKVYNFGINGATAQVVDWLLHKLLTPEQLPRMILWADGSRAFNNGRVDHTFNKITASKGYKWLAQQRRTSPENGFELGRVCLDMLPVTIPTQQSSQTKLYIDRSNSTKAERSPTACNQSIKVVVRPGNSHRESVTQPLSLEDLGFQVVDSRFTPNTYFQRYPKIPGDYDADYKNFTLSGRQMESFDRVVQFANSRKIPLVFANLPLTTTYLDVARTYDEERFRSRMRNVADSKRFVFKDLTVHQSLSQNQYFADPSHLNRYGAIVVATRLGKELAPAIRSFFRQSAAAAN